LTKYCDILKILLLYHFVFSFISMNLLHSLRLLSPAPLSPNKPLWVYLPGMDGTGKLFYRQLKGLLPWFDVRCLMIPPQNRSSWEQLANQAIALVQDTLAQKAQIAKALSQKISVSSVYLCGESFGGCLALKIAENASWPLGQLILVNPASSFAQYPFLSLGSTLTRWSPEWLYKGTTWGFLPFLASIELINPKDREILLRAMQLLSPADVSWRLSLLSQFKFKADAIAPGEQFPLILASESDRLLPSRLEARRLRSLLGSVHIHTLPKSGHACLLEKELDLSQILQDKDLLPHLAEFGNQDLGVDNGDKNLSLAH
jgi:pimeloyl-ACP methyl ester carboxylesterase